MFDSVNVSFACALTALVALTHSTGELHGFPIGFRTRRRPASRQLQQSVERLIHAAKRIRLMIDPLAPEHQELLDIIDGLFMRLCTAPAGTAQQDKRAEVAKRIVTLGLTVIRLLAPRGA
jgi:hypothetical protein